MIVSAELKHQTDRTDAAMGAISLAEYRAEWYGETLEEVAKNLPEPALTKE